MAPQRRTMLGVGEREREERARVALVRADVVTRDLAHAQRHDGRPGGDERRDRVGELKLAGPPGAKVAQCREDRGRHHVPRADGERARRDARMRLLDDRLHPCDAVLAGVGDHDDAVAPGVRARHIVHGDRACRPVLRDRRGEPSDHRRMLARAQDRIAQCDREAPVADEPLGVQHRVAEPAWAGLDHGCERHARGLAGEMLLDRLLPRCGDEHDAVDPACGQLLDDVLDDRPAAERQHLLRQRPRRRPQSCATAGNGHDRGRHAHRNGGDPR